MLFLLSYFYHSKLRVVFKFKKKKKKNSPNLHKRENNKGKDSGIL